MFHVLEFVAVRFDSAPRFVNGFDGIRHSFLEMPDDFFDCVRFFVEDQVFRHPSTGRGRHVAVMLTALLGLRDHSLCNLSLNENRDMIEAEDLIDNEDGIVFLVFWIHKKTPYS